MRLYRRLIDHMGQVGAGPATGGRIPDGRRMNTPAAPRRPMLRSAQRRGRRQPPRRSASARGKWSRVAGAVSYSAASVSLPTA
jgi:hypothetical protein